MSARTVLVTGASGYAGGAIAAWLRRAGWQVLVAGRRAGAHIALDLSDPAKVASLKLPSRIDACVHAAAAHEGICTADPALAAVINVAGTEALLAAVESAGIPRFVYLSTFHVYGRPSGLITEDCPVTPASAYGLTHWEAEELVRSFGTRTGSRIHILRPANLFGMPAEWETFDRWSLAPFDFAQQAVRQGKIRLRTNGKQVRSFVPLERLCRAAEAMLVGSLTPSTVHIGGDHWRIGDIAVLCARVASQRLNREVPVELGQANPNEQQYQFSSKFWLAQGEESSGVTVKADPRAGEQQADTDMAAFLGAVVDHLAGSAA